MKSQLISALLIAFLAVPVARADKLGDAQRAADQAKQEANDATSAAADSEKTACDAPKSAADKAADKADQQAEKDEQAARDARDQADKSQADKDANQPGSAAQAAKDEQAAQAAEAKAAQSEAAAQAANKKADKGEGRDNPQKINRDRQTEKRKKQQEAWEKNRKLKKLKQDLGIKVSNELPSLIRDGLATATVTSTGETIGTVATVQVHNTTASNIAVTVPATMLLAQDGKSQNYAIPQSTTALVPPDGKTDIPLDGVCVQAHRPPAEKGSTTTLALADPHTPEFQKTYAPQLETTQKVINVATRLQQEGKFKTPFSSNPKKELQTVIQQTVWTANPSHDGTATTKEDLTHTVYKQVNVTTEEQKKQLQPGIDSIWSAVQLTGVTAKVLTENVSNDSGGAPSPAPKEETPKTQEKPKPAKPDPWTEEGWKEFGKFFSGGAPELTPQIEKWLQAHQATKDAKDARKAAQDKLNKARQDFLDQNKHYREVRDKADQAKAAADKSKAAAEKSKADAAKSGSAADQAKAAADQTQADADAAKSKAADRELGNLTLDLGKDFSQTPEGKTEAKAAQAAEHAVDQAEKAENTAGNGIDKQTKEAVEKAQQQAEQQAPEHEEQGRMEEPR